MWESVISYFNTLEQRPGERLALLVGGLLFFWIIEGAIPLVQPRYKKNKLKHAGVNFIFTLIHLLTHTVLAIFIVLLSDWCKANGFGLVYWSGAGIFGTILISFLALDLIGSWLAHFTEHKIPWLWRFHIVHHSDNNVDVTTGLRHHPFESVLRGLFFFLAIFISGSPIYAVMIFQTITVVFTAFNHANIRLPAGVDRIISFLFVSPNMHKVHHHWKQPFTDSNYGTVLAVWDRMFGTYKELDHKLIRYGLDKHYPNEEDENLILLFKKPFQKLDAE